MDFYEPPSWVTDKTRKIHFVIGPVPEENKQRRLKDLHKMIEELREDLGDIINKSVSIVDDKTYEKYRLYEFLLNAENRIKEVIIMEATTKFIKKAEDLKYLLNTYIYGGYTEKQWENKAKVDNSRKATVSKKMRELREILLDGYVDTDKLDLYKLESLFRQCENYIAEEDLYEQL